MLLTDDGWRAAWSAAHIPEQTHGTVRVSKRTVDPAFASFDRLRGAMDGTGRYVPPGSYTGLHITGSGLVMSDTPDEYRDHFNLFIEAARRGGRVLIHGLGLGCALRVILSMPDVTHVDVVEINPDVIDVIGPTFDADPRVTIHHGDALTHRWPTGTRWDVVWHDIWPDICEDNLPDMIRLHRRFGRRCDWQGSWSRAIVERERRRTGVPW